MNSIEAVSAVIDSLEACGIEYMLVGAFSANAYGIGRSTNGADFVVDLSSETNHDLTKQLGPDFRLDPQMQLEAFTGSKRNVITFVPTGFQIELFRLNTTDAHHAERFRRRQRIRLGDLNRDVWLPTAEDVVIQKLRWQRRKDLDDVVNILAVNERELDWEYLRLWTMQHGTESLLQELFDSIPDLDGLEDR